MGSTARHAEVAVAARAALGPFALFVRAEARLVGALLRHGETVETVLGAALPSRTPLGRGCVVVGTSDRLLVVDATAWRSRHVLADVPWSQVGEVQVSGSSVVLGTDDGPLRLRQVVPGSEIAVVAELAAGDEDAPVRAVRAVFRRVFGKRTWLYDEAVGPIARVLHSGEALVEVAESYGRPAATLALTSQRVGLVPHSSSTAPVWFGLSDIEWVRYEDDSIALGTSDGHEAQWTLTPKRQVALLAARLGTAADVRVDAPAPGGPSDEREEEDDWEDEDWEDEDGTGSWPRPPDDALAARLAAFARELAQSLGAAGSVGEEIPGWVTLRPSDPAAAVVSWADSGDELRLEIGWGAGGVMYRPRTPEDAELLVTAVRAVVAGRFGTVHGPGRSRTTLSLPGRTLAMPTVRSGWVGRIPLPAWQRWGRREHPKPYRRAG